MKYFLIKENVYCSLRKCLFVASCDVFDAFFSQFQVLTYNGFYDLNLEWIGLDSITVIGSMNPATSLGRHAITTRLTAIMRICAVG